MSGITETEKLIERRRDGNAWIVLTPEQIKYVEKRVIRMASEVADDIRQGYLESGEQDVPLNVIRADMIQNLQAHYIKAIHKWGRLSLKYSMIHDFDKSYECTMKERMAIYARVYCVDQVIKNVK